MLLSFWTLLAVFGLSLASPVPATPLPTSNTKELEAREADLNKFLSQLLAHLPAISGSITAVSGALTSFQTILALLTHKSTTYNQLQSGPCKPYTVIFARGTVEPGNVGILVGPPFFDALRMRVGKSGLAVQGVNGYKADVEGYLGGGDEGGSVVMGDQIVMAMQKCPDTKLVVAGYSQGGQLVHKALGGLSAETAAFVSKVVVFGDPNNGTAIANVDPTKVLTICHEGDDICRDGVGISPIHLTYGLDAMSAAAFVAA